MPPTTPRVRSPPHSVTRFWWGNPTDTGAAPRQNRGGAGSQTQQRGDSVVAAGGVAAVDRQRDAGDERSVGRHEKRRDRRDLVGPAEATELVLAPDLGSHRLE